MVNTEGHLYFTGKKGVTAYSFYAFAGMLWGTVWYVCDHLMFLLTLSSFLRWGHYLFTGVVKHQAMTVLCGVPRVDPISVGVR